MSSFRSGRLAVVSLPATAVVATVHFYRDVMGLRLLPHHGHRPAFELENECFLAIVPGKASTTLETDESLFPAIAFAVDNLDH